MELGSETCRKFTRSYVRHLFKAKEMLGLAWAGRIAQKGMTYENVAVSGWAVTNTETSGSYGFEGYLLYDISQLATNNPFDENAVLIRFESI